VEFAAAGAFKSIEFPSNAVDYAPPSFAFFDFLYIQKNTHLII
jgi:hypothetical protein